MSEWEAHRDPGNRLIDLEQLATSAVSTERLAQADTLRRGADDPTAVALWIGYRLGVLDAEDGPELFAGLLEEHADELLTQARAGYVAGRAGFRDRFRKEWPGQRLPAVFYDPRGLDPDPKCWASLHAKVVIIDQKRSFVTSANFTEAAQVKNIEVGILLKDPLFAAQLTHHFESLAAAGVLTPVKL